MSKKIKRIYSSQGLVDWIIGYYLAVGSCNLVFVIALKLYYSQFPFKSLASIHSTTTAVPLAATSIITIPL
jgi:hypothetical protein